MIKSYIALSLSVLLSLSVPLPAFAKGAPQGKPTVQEKVVLIQAGSVVEVKTKDKRKVQGRLLAVASDSFDVQSAKGKTIGKQTFRFDEVKDVKQIQKEGGMSTGEKITIGALIGAAAVVVILLLAYVYGDY